MAANGFHQRFLLAEMRGCQIAHSASERFGVRVLQHAMHYNSVDLAPSGLSLLRIILSRTVCNHSH